MMNKHRWLGADGHNAQSQPKVSRPVGGRFPIIEEKIQHWMDARLANGLECTDADARQEAKRIAREMGFSDDRFKGSLKWWESVKFKRKQAGKPLNTRDRNKPQSVTSPTSPFPPAGGMLTRTPSSRTISSTSSMNEVYQPSPIHSAFSNSVLSYPQHNYSETDLHRVDVTPTSRQRSQSSPQVFCEPGILSPSSGRARTVRPVPLSRQGSYRGTSPSPRLVRGNSSQGGSLRRQQRPPSLGASVFGITPISQDAPVSPSPLSPYHVGHARHASDASQSTMMAMANMSISPSMSSTLSTPVTPGFSGSTGTFGPNEYVDAPMFNEYGHQVPMHGMPTVIEGTMMGPQYPTMPNKHYDSQYTVQPAFLNEFGVPQGHPPVMGHH